MRLPSCVAILLFLVAILWQWALTSLPHDWMASAQYLDDLVKGFLDPDHPLHRNRGVAGPRGVRGDGTVTGAVFTVVAADGSRGGAPVSEVFAASWSGLVNTLEMALEAEEWDEAYNVWQLMAAEHQAQISNANARSAPAASPSVVAAQQLAKLRDLLQRQGATEREVLTTALYAVHAASTFGTGAHASISESGAAELIRQVMVRFPRLVSEGEAALWRLWKRSGQRELDAQVTSDCFSLMGSECDESPVTNLR
jgi:hypothetical protein